MRLAIKPGVSLQSTTDLPSKRSPKVRSAAMASGRVFAPATSSSSRM